MAWLDTKVLLTDKQFKAECDGCRMYCQEANKNIPCGGAKFSCPYYEEIDSDDYDKDIRNKAIDEFAEKIKSEIANCSWQFSRLEASTIDEIAEQLKEESNGDKSTLM